MQNTASDKCICCIFSINIHSPLCWWLRLAGDLRLIRPMPVLRLGTVAPQIFPSSSLHPPHLPTSSLSPSLPPSPLSLASLLPLRLQPAGCRGITHWQFKSQQATVTRALPDPWLAGPLSGSVPRLLTWTSCGAARAVRGELAGADYT